MNHDTLTHIFFIN